MSKDTPKYNKLTPKNAREQGSKLLKENGSEDFRKCSENECKRAQSQVEKNSSSAKNLKNSARAKIKNPRGRARGRRTAQSHALQKEIL